jgi:glutamine synthetase
MHSLLYTIEAYKHSKDEVIALIKSHPEIQYVSLVSVDLGNNHTDERIPVGIMLEDYEAFITFGIQTDGSSVNLPIIAEINNARVDLIPDCTVRWIIDYNTDNIDRQTSRPVGTLLIPAILLHEGQAVDSRSVLKRGVHHFTDSIKALFTSHPAALTHFGLASVDDILDVQLTAATELEFWVKTPDYKTDTDKLSTSQNLKEQYWKRTVGPVRTALEKSLLQLNRYGLEAEMGHKEVGGVTSKLKGTNDFSHIMEQLEIDWKYDNALQTADNELFARDIIGDTFVKLGLEVTFQAKPIDGVAGSGEHHHVGVALKLKNGKTINLFSPQNMTSHFLNPMGYGALMGILKNYEILNPLVTSSNDSFNRLKPGFEAPVCIVSSLGHTYDVPSRNRTVLIGLVRDINNSRATRFELRAPNPHSNTYLVLAGVYQAMLDGIKAVVQNNFTADQALSELSKPYGQAGIYLEKNRCYRSEEDVFEHYSEEERSRLFGAPPKTVWENVQSLSTDKERQAVLFDGNVFTEAILDSYGQTIISHWITELRNRIVLDNMELVRSFKRLHSDEKDGFVDLDVVNWERIHTIRLKLMKDTLVNKSLFTHLRESIEYKNYDHVSSLQIEMRDTMDELKKLYSDYKQNLFDIK